MNCEAQFDFYIACISRLTHKYFSLDCLSVCSSFSHSLMCWPAETKCCLEHTCSTKSLHCNNISGEGHILDINFHAHREKLIQERVTIKSQTDTSKFRDIVLHARVLGEYKESKMGP